MLEEERDTGGYQKEMPLIATYELGFVKSYVTFLLSSDHSLIITFLHSLPFFPYSKVPTHWQKFLIKKMLWS
jgi:hypothetical protein